jgi:hypothetical protein
MVVSAIVQCLKWWWAAAAGRESGWERHKEIGNTHEDLNLFEGIHWESASFLSFYSTSTISQWRFEISSSRASQNVPGRLLRPNIEEAPFCMGLVWEILFTK